MISKNNNIKEERNKEKVADWIDDFKRSILERIQHLEIQLDSIAREKNGLAKDLKTAHTQLDELKKARKKLEDKVEWYEKVHQGDIKRIKELKSKLDNRLEFKEFPGSDLKTNNNGLEESKLIAKFKEELKQIGEELKQIEEPVQSEPTYRPKHFDPIRDLSTARKGGFWIRLIAISIDSIIINILSFILIIGLLALYLSSIGWDIMYKLEIYGFIVLFYILSIIISITYYTYFYGSTGQTPGKMVCRLKVVQINGEPLGYSKAFLRWIGYIVSSFVFCIGFLWTLWDKNKQTWHDKIAGTYVIKM